MPPKWGILDGEGAVRISKHPRTAGAWNMEEFWQTTPRVHSFEVHDFENIWAERTHTTRRIELLYVLEGRFTLTLANGLKFPAVAGDFLLIPEQVLHRDVFEPIKGLRILMIQFDWAHSAEYFSVVNNRTLCDLDFATRAEAMRRINFMYEQWEPGDLGKRNLGVHLHSLLTMFYVSAVRSAGNAAPSPVLKRARSDMMQQVKFFLSHPRFGSMTLASVIPSKRGSE